MRTICGDLPEPNMTKRFTRKFFWTRRCRIGDNQAVTINLGLDSIRKNSQINL